MTPLKCKLFTGVAVLAASLMLAGTTQAKDVPHRETCGGTLDTITADTMFFSGVGNATHFGRYSITGSHNFDAAGNILNGQFTTSTSNGDTISGVYSGTFQVQPDGSAVFTVVVNWLQGTGRLAGVTGTASVVAVLDEVVPGGRLRYVTDGTLALP